MAARPFTNSRYLTKSLFQKACECPRKLIYAVSSSPATGLYYKQKDSSGFLDALAEDGMKIGVYSRLLFPDGIEISKANNNCQADAVEQTKMLLETNETVTIFEGAFLAGDCLIRADIVQKTAPHKLHLMEVKAKTWDSCKGRSELLVGKRRGGIKADFLPYLRDVAFQKYVITQAMPEFSVESSSLILPDKAKVNTKIPNLYGLFTVDRDTGAIMLDNEAQQRIIQANEMLVTRVDVTGLVENLLQSELKFPGSQPGTLFTAAIAEWGKIVQSKDDAECLNDNYYAPPPIGHQCGDCEFRIIEEGNQNSGFATCWKQATRLEPEQQKDLVIDIYFGSKSMTEKLLDRHKYLMAHVEPMDLGLADDGTDTKKKEGHGISRSERQWYQVHTDAKKVILDRDYLEKEMKEWQYPYHFVDFETISPALPYTTKKRPYDTLAFQFSHHILTEDGTVEHASEFLYTEPGQCPNIPFLDALTDSLGNSREGSVFRWGAHENTVLLALLRSEQYSGNSTIESLLMGGDREMVDLARVVTKGYYVDGSQGSSSIKKLLLPTMRQSKRLKELYSQPTYSSSNFTDMQWWQGDETNKQDPRDPYFLLSSSSACDDTSPVSHGGDAIVAYKVLQDSRLDPKTRAAIRASLLRYCELDTLAMVIITQGLQDLLETVS